MSILLILCFFENQESADIITNSFIFGTTRFHCFNAVKLHVNHSLKYGAQYIYFWLVGWSLTLLDVHCVGVSERLQIVRRPRDVIYLPKSMTNSFQTSISKVFISKVYFFKSSSECNTQYLQFKGI